MVTEAEGKIQIGRPKRKSKDNIKMDITKAEWQDVD
jgi:hypothetical protein